MPPADYISISRLSIRIAAITGKPGPSPRKVYDLVLRGVIPAEYIDGRWYSAEASVPAIADLWLRHSDADRLVDA
jgi:hypothetical protein